MELINLIVSAAMPGGFEALMLSCKTVYESNKSLITRHNDLRRRYSRVVLGHGLQATIPLLLSISHDPLIADYVEDLDLWTCAHRRPPPNAMREDEMMTLEWARELDPLILQAACMHEPDASPYALLHEVAAVEEFLGLHAHMTVTLLAVLPNLRRLTPTTLWNIGHVVTRRDGVVANTASWNLLKTLVDRANDRRDAMRPLQKLELVRPCSALGYGSYPGLYTFSPLMAVPSVTKMCLASCKGAADSSTPIPFIWTNPLFGSNIERLELAGCCVNGPGISDIVQHMPKLRVLRYSQETKWHGCLHDWDAGGFIAYTGKWCSSSLRELSITMPGLFGDFDGAAPFLKQFTALENLEIDVRCLETHQSYYYADPPLTPTVRPSVTLASADAVYCLADILPRSIKALRLIASGSRTNHELIRRLLEGLRTRQSRDLPDFEHLEVCRATPVSGYDRDASADAEWSDLAEMMPSTMSYLYSVANSTEPAWYTQLFQQYPSVKG